MRPDFPRNLPEFLRRFPDERGLRQETSVAVVLAASFER